MRKQLIVAMCGALLLVTAGCAYSTADKVIARLLPAPSGVVLRIENPSDATIIIETFAVTVCEPSGDRTIRTASDYTGWFPLSLSANTVVEFTIESDATRPHGATIEVAEDKYSSKRYAVKYVP